MKKRPAVLPIVFFALFLATAARAQKAEIFAGYQYSHLDPSFNANGWNGSATGNIGEILGVTADVSGVYKSGTKFYTYTFGPEFHAPLPLVKPFVHALFGGATASGGGGSTNGFAMYVGGGLDAGHGLIGWRLIQVDWLHTRFEGVNDNKNTRISTGLLLRF